MSENQSVAVVLSTCPLDAAPGLARRLVERRLAACVNVIPKVTSFYWWEGKLEEDAESLLVIKCPRGGVETLTAEIAEAHPYDVPEVVALDVVAGNRAYLEWVQSSTEAK